MSALFIGNLHIIMIRKSIIVWVDQLLLLQNEYLQYFGNYQNMKIHDMGVIS